MAREVLGHRSARYRRERLLSVDGVVFDRANQVGRQVHVELFQRLDLAYG